MAQPVWGLNVPVGDPRSGRTLFVNAFSAVVSARDAGGSRSALVGENLRGVRPQPKSDPLTGEPLIHPISDLVGSGPVPTRLPKDFLPKRKWRQPRAPSPARAPQPGSGSGARGAGSTALDRSVQLGMNELI